jgi:hypothetical protein
MQDRVVLVKTEVSQERLTSVMAVKRIGRLRRAIGNIELLVTANVVPT